MHPHKTTSNRKILRRRRARQAWKNYAALEGLKVVIVNDMVTLYSIRDGMVRRSTAINISVSPARVIKNPELILWFFDTISTAWADAGTSAKLYRRRIRGDHKLVRAFIAGD